MIKKSFRCFGIATIREGSFRKYRFLYKVGFSHPLPIEELKKFASQIANFM